MHFIGTVTVKFKKSVLEPQGQAVLLSLRENEISGIDNVRIGKYIEVDLDEPDKASAEKKLSEVAEKLLYNPVMEVCQISVKEA